MDYMDYRNVLCHHGIPGQQWGVRHGPPYPLNRVKHGQKSSTGSETKKAELDSPLKLINPLYSSGDERYTTNCMNCAVAYEARRRGIMCVAKPRSKDDDIKDFTMVRNLYGNAAVKSMRLVVNPKNMDSNKTKSIQKILNRSFETSDDFSYSSIVEEEMCRDGDGARGYVSIDFSGLNVGHAMAYEVFRTKDGKLEAAIVDAQTAKVYSPEIFDTVVDLTYILRTDNLQFNEEKAFEKYIDKAAK